MFAGITEAWPVCIIVKLDELIPPPDKHRKTGVKQNAYDRLQALGPSTWFSEGSLRPIEFPCEQSHFATVLKKRILYLPVGSIHKLI
jgi:hypothetical protein